MVQPLGVPLPSVSETLLSRKVEMDFPGAPVVNIHLPVQRTQVQPLVWEDPTCC